MRLLLVTNDFAPKIGGVSTWAMELATQLAERTERLALVAPEHPRAPEIDRRLPFEVHRAGSASTDAFNVLAGPRVAKLAREGRFDVGLGANWHSALPLLAARHVSGLATVGFGAHAQELLLEPLRAVPALESIYDRTRARAIRRADRIFAVSRYTRDLLLRFDVDPSRIAVVPNGTSPDRFAPADATALRSELGIGGRRALLTIARLVPRKGIDTVIDLLPRVAESVPDVVYVVVGSGPDEPRLRRLVDERGLASRVRFVGEVEPDALVRYHNLADAFVLAARRDGESVEGFGLVFLEASACEKPVIGMRSGGVPDAVIEGETGLLVDEGDRAGLASAIVRVLSDHVLARSLGRGGRVHVLANGTWRQTAASILRSFDASTATSSVTHA